MHAPNKIPAKTCPRCLGEGKQLPQNCGVCVECHGHGTVPNIRAANLGVIAVQLAKRSWARPSGFVPDLFVASEAVDLGAVRHFKVSPLAAVA